MDSYNGGCNSDPPVFQPIWGDGQGTAILCGRSGTYLYEGMQYRDTDWFQVVGTGGPLTASLRAEFSPQLIFIYNADCENLQYSITSGLCVETLTLEHTMESGAIAWIWVGPSAFSDVSCSLMYILEVTGIAEEPTPVEGTVWGSIKRMFR